MRTRTVLGFLCAGVAVAVLGVAALGGDAPPPAPAPFDQLGDWCAHFDRISLAVIVPRDWTVENEYYLVYASGDGRVAVERSGLENMARPVRYTWTRGSEVLSDATWTPEPIPVPEATPFFEALFDECRSGFAHSHWVPVRNTGRPTALLELPFTSTAGTTVEVIACGQNNPTPVRVIIDAGNGPGSVEIGELFWNAAFPDDVFNPNASPDPLPIPPRWRHDADECEQYVNDPDLFRENRCRAEWSRLSDPCALPGLTSAPPSGAGNPPPNTAPPMPGGNPPPDPVPPP